MHKLSNIDSRATRRYSVTELARETNMSTAFWRKRIWLGDVEVERFGRSVRISHEALERYLASRTTRTEAA